MAICIATQSLSLVLINKLCSMCSHFTVTRGDPECDDDNSVSLSTGVIVAITLVLTLLVSLPVGVIIGCYGMWCIMKSHKQQEKVQQLQGGTNVVIYEELDVKIDTDIPLSDNQAYGHVNMQRRRN